MLKKLKRHRKDRRTRRSRGGCAAKLLKDKITPQTIKIAVLAVLVIVVGAELGYIVTQHRSNKLNEQKQSEEIVHSQTNSADDKSETESESDETDGESTDGEQAGEQDNAAQPRITNSPKQTDTNNSSKIIVLDPGHGKSSSQMSDSEKAASGWKQTSQGWGEWRHFKIGSGNVDCEGSGCNGRHTPNGGCWYPIGNGDRNVEPDINLQNALAAKRYLEAMGYTVRMTRTTNDENPSITRRLEYCYPNNDKTQAPDAELFLCIHSNASNGSARGTAYIQLEGPYDQKWIPSSDSYTNAGNHLGKLCNDEIISGTSLASSGGGAIGGEPQLIAFMKAPVTCGYLEIGFFDNTRDIEILKSESDSIGKAIAAGVDKFCRSE